MKRIAVLTSGGDASGMNCAIRAVVRTSIASGLQVYGVMRGFLGLYENDFIHLNSRSVSSIINKGGTILRTIRFPEFKNTDVQKKCLKNLKEKGIDALVVIGGDGSSRGAFYFHSNTDFPVCVIPASIDNDVCCTDFTIGFDTAVNTALEAIDRIRDTATSHERIFVVEVMGREHGFLAIEVAIAAGAEIVLIPERPVFIEEVIRILQKDKEMGKVSSLIILAEGAGKAHEIARQINEKMEGAEARYSVLGYIQRGGVPTYQTRYLATVFGNHAVKGLLDGLDCFMVGIKGSNFCKIPLKDVVSGSKEISEEKLKIIEQMAI
ncbi:MAG: 6-phosphofructokinase [Candidatus Omnitrophica bacterium]|nr:6-phosphofructokinase [Candidatus Omnitrophota bacterium]MCM8827856.1 6-phosphofructokinase [Candidatus Omnitrophota bacterium]